MFWLFFDFQLRDETTFFASINSFVIGIIAGIVVVFAVEFFDQSLKIDDPVGAISVHGVCGALGTILVGVFAVDGGLHVYVRVTNIKSVLFGYARSFYDLIDDTGIWLRLYSFTLSENLRKLYGREEMGDELTGSGLIFIRSDCQFYPSFLQQG